MEKIQKKIKRGQILSIIQWVILLSLAILIPILFPIYQNKSGWWGWMFPLFMFIIHSLEAILYGIPTGKEYGYTKLESLCLTWLYGFTWWKYKRQEESLKKEDKNNK